MSSQPVGAIIWGERVFLEFRPHEKLEFGVAALDPPARQYVGQDLDAGHALAGRIFGAVAVEAAGQEDLQEQAVLLETAWRKYDPAVAEGAVAPEIAAREQQE